MKIEQIRFRIEPALKRSFTAAAKFRHQTLSQFLVQAGISAVEDARSRGLSIKPPPSPTDARRREFTAIGDGQPKPQQQQEVA